MDRATLNLVVRTAGSFGLAALLVHAGMETIVRPWPGLALVPFFLLALGASWAMARLNVKRAALWTTLVLLGALPVLNLLGHVRHLGEHAAYDGALYAGAAFGAMTLVAAGLLLLLARKD